MMDTVKRRRDRRVWFVALGVFVAVFLFAFLAQRFDQEEADAANMAGFDPGYIISDYQMGNYNSMSEAQIQAFLTSKNSCSTTNYSYYQSLSAGSSYTWHWDNGHFVCLSEERFGDGEVIGSGDTAAHIIWQAAQDYRINPQVLIVLLQKETGLITDPIPNNGDYRKATGFGCPDTAACSSEYYGFKNQVRHAAALFRAVLNGGWTNYPLGNNYVKYNPNSACGGTVVNIRSLATSALYRYTPYQPNASALGTPYGYGDGCSSYGNRNFYSYFEDWFGGITSEGYAPLSTVLYTNRIPNVDTNLGLTYRVHAEHYGWMNWVDGGSMAGTSGFGIRLEALSLKLTGGLSGIEYKTHVQDIGWTDYVKDGEISGTTGQAKQIEAIKIRLSGDLAKNYDVYYRAHVQDKGWMKWVKNGETAGTEGESLRLEAIQIRVLRKELGPDYTTHVQNLGWMDWVKNGEVTGTTGKSLRVEAFKIKLPDNIKEGDIKYRVHVQNIGWMDWVKNGTLAGTTGQALRVEALQIKLSDDLAKKYDIRYKVHVQDIGWTGWMKNGEVAGTTGQAKRIEAARIELQEK